eukprot:4427631-Amphidinium_carterae.1
MLSAKGAPCRGTGVSFFVQHRSRIFFVLPEVQQKAIVCRLAMARIWQCKVDAKECVLIKGAYQLIWDHFNSSTNTIPLPLFSSCFKRFTLFICSSIFSGLPYQRVP